ncbi:MAG: DUF2970 domain-containing protein [Halomonadaceae bacterium]|nr:MAG: DUF2970 domain-containing protein [Halomonadaceae bacterium]
MQAHSDEHKPENDQKKPFKPSLWQLVVSILGAALGVQSSKVREQDFNSSSPMPYIIGLIVFGIIFVLSIALVVSLVLRSVGN